MGSERLYLERERKIKLIEILLIVGSFLAAFQLPTNMIWIFMIFILFALVYYILIQSGAKESDAVVRMSAILISFPFIAIVTYNLGVSLVKTFPEISLITMLLVAIYYVVFGMLLTLALTKTKK